MVEVNCGGCAFKLVCILVDALFLLDVLLWWKCKFVKFLSSNVNFSGSTELWWRCFQAGVYFGGGAFLCQDLL